MNRTAVLLAMTLLILVPLGVAQGPSDPGGQSGDPSARPSGPPQNETNQTGSSGPATGGPPDGNGASDGTPAEKAARGGSSVVVEDARDGFGARPEDPGSQRPAFSYNASRGAIALDRSGQEVLEAVFDALIEFRDEDGDGAYDVGEAVVQRLGVRDLNETVEDLGPTQRDAVYALPDGGELRIRFQMAPDGAADGAKFDVLITDFPFKAGDTRVALATGVDVPGLHAGVVGGHPAVLGSGEDHVPYLSWIPTAEVDGTSTEVASSVHVAADGQGVVYWAYERGNVSHDPLVGLASVPIERLGDAPAFLASLGVAVILIAGGFEVRRRYRP